MTVDALIKNWAVPEQMHRIYTDPEVFRAIRTTERNLVFIATLWSGTSQVAFRQLLKCISEVPGTNVPILVLDGDLQIPHEFQIENTDQSGQGSVLLFSGDKLESTATGGNLTRFRSLVLEFLRRDAGE